MSVFYKDQRPGYGARVIKDPDGSHHYAHAGYGEVFARKPELTQAEKDRALNQFATSPLDTGTHRLITRVHRVDVDSIRYDETEGTLYLPINLREVIGVEFHKGVLSRHGYNVNAGTFAIAVDGGAAVTATVTAATYTASTLAEHIQAVIRAATSDANFTCTYSATAEKFTVASGSAATFTLQFTTAMVGYTLGFGHDTYDFTTKVPTKIELSSTVFPTTGAATSVESPFRADLVGARYMEMHSPDLDAFYGNSHALIDSVHVIDDVNIDAGNDREARRFMQAINIDTLKVNLRVRMPTGELVVYAPQQRAFQLTFRVFTLDMEKIRRRPLRK